MWIVPDCFPMVKHWKSNHHCLLQWTAMILRIGVTSSAILVWCQVKPSVTSLSYPGRLPSDSDPWIDSTWFCSSPCLPQSSLMLAALRTPSVNLRHSAVRRSLCAWRKTGRICGLARPISCAPVAAGGIPAAIFISPTSRRNSGIGSNLCQK